MRSTLERLRSGRGAVALAALAVSGCAASGAAPGAGATPAGVAAMERAYTLLVTNESSDLVSRVEFHPERGARLVADVPVGIMPADTDAPHGVVADPGGRYYYVSIAHGQPFGTVWKLDARTDSLIGRETLGHFPASMGLTPDGEFLYVVNFNLHGDPVPSTVSVVHTPTMTQVAQPTTCVMPHGTQVNDAGTRNYSACMHSEQLVEIDTRTFQVSARFGVAPGSEGRLPLEERGEGHGAHAGHQAAERCSPTWVTPGRGARASRFVYVPCNRNREVLEVDVERWEVTRRFATGPAPYNSAISPDGRLLVVTLKAGAAAAVIDLERGREVARIPTSRDITHGVVISEDGSYAFVTNEAVGGTRGTLDVIDLARLERIASVELHLQPGGVALLPDAS